ncbi:hypothetical protein GH714_000550 [Hevea brasiliensis]|uniref:Cytochrome P450 n=1 Tax=Hevea brasiliensis TaxID=3981 RepID=A0A6A6LMK2_HEVBR|nr:hypothetical protein GH714_000550 [Hevea brasiliensis]
MKLLSADGPPSYPIIGCLLSFYKNRYRLLDWYTYLLSVSPTQTIVVERLGARRTIVTANPANVEHMLKTNFSNFPKGKPFTEILGDLLGCGIFNVDGELWNMQRKLASHEFSTKSLREFVVKTLQEEVENRLIPLLEEAADGEKVLDLQDMLRRFAFDIVCRVSLGTDPFGLDLSLPLPPLVKAFDAASEIRHASVLEIIQNKKRFLENDQERKQDNDLLSRFLSAGHDEEVIRDMVISFIMAGRDTTSAAMTWLFWLLSKHQSSEEMIVDEVETLLNKEWTTCGARTASSLNQSGGSSKPVGLGNGGATMKTVSPYKFPVFQAGPRVCLGKEMSVYTDEVRGGFRSEAVRGETGCRGAAYFVPLLTAHMAGGLKVMVKRRR